MESNLLELITEKSFLEIEETANELKKCVSRIAAFFAGYYLLPDSQNMLHQKANAGNSDPAA